MAGLRERLHLVLAQTSAQVRGGGEASSGAAHGAGVGPGPSWTPPLSQASSTWPTSKWPSVKWPSPESKLGRPFREAHLAVAHEGAIVEAADDEVAVARVDTRTPLSRTSSRENSEESSGCPRIVRAHAARSGHPHPECRCVCNSSRECVAAPALSAQGRVLPERECVAAPVLSAQDRECVADSVLGARDRESAARVCAPPGVLGEDLGNEADTAEVPLEARWIQLLSERPSTGRPAPESCHGELLSQGPGLGTVPWASASAARLEQQREVDRLHADTAWLEPAARAWASTN